jgi:hypothetical protein
MIFQGLNRPSHSAALNEAFSHALPVLRKGMGSRDMESGNCNCWRLIEPSMMRQVKWLNGRVQRHLMIATQGIAIREHQMPRDRIWIATHEIG